VQFPFFVALDELGVFEREPLLPALNRISEFVSKTVCGFDSLFSVTGWTSPLDFAV
jgi:hypothetical protein